MCYGNKAQITILLMTETQLTLAGKKITIKKLPIRKLTDVIQRLSGLPDDLKSQIANLDKESTEETLAKTPMLIATALPHIADIVALACNSDDVTADFLLDECGVDDAMELVNALIELNNIKSILDNAKKMQALYLNKPQKTLEPIKK